MSPPILWPLQAPSEQDCRGSPKPALPTLFDHRPHRRGRRYLLRHPDGTVLVKPPGKRAVRLAAGDSFGEMALLDDAPRSATVEAQDEVFVMLLSRSAFSKMLATEPKIAIALLRTLAQRLRALETSPSH